MNIAEKKRAEAYVNDTIVSLQSKLKEQKDDEKPSSKAVKALEDYRKALQIITDEGWTVSGTKLIRPYNYVSKARNEMYRRRDALIQVGREVVRRIWNNDVTFDNIDAVIREVVIDKKA